jgi:hypothetical protein
MMRKGCFLRHAAVQVATHDSWTTILQPANKCISQPRKQRKRQKSARLHLWMDANIPQHDFPHAPHMRGLFQFFGNEVSRVAWLALNKTRTAK